MTTLSVEASTAIDTSALVVEDLRVLATRKGQPSTEIVAGISFSVRRGETLGFVGESGSGKSLTAMSLMRILPAPLTQTGSIVLDGVAIDALSERAMREVRGGKISMIFQDPMTGLNPVRSIGSALCEVLSRHNDLSGKEAEARAIAAMVDVGIPSAAERMHAYPHQLSGGLRQRVMIAMALLNDPVIIIGDEPTTALDATIQAQILDLLRKRVTSAGLIMITHDLGVAAEICDRVAVMYAGHIVEFGEVATLLSAPRHPYTVGLLAAAPRFGRRHERMVPIPGAPPSPFDRPLGCPFAPRCARATDQCVKENPPLVATERSAVACWHPHE
jgi:oligopeptide/dipeptide ABC transporter ATP-binding protein